MLLLPASSFLMVIGDGVVVKLEANSSKKSGGFDRLEIGVSVVVPEGE